ncbi:MAG: DUF2341 domain-containing protein [Deltaproteobacteria bacterium]|nr:DUF2341 domain-containing protein [Deltaproteobacteria bacterium]
MSDVLPAVRPLLLTSISAAFLACSGESAGPTTGLELEVHYDSSLPIEELVVVLTPKAGAAISRNLAPPLDLDPPGIRRPRFTLELEAGPTGTVLIHVDGKNGRTVLGSGEVQVDVTTGQMTPAVVVLAGANPCGPGGCARCGNGRIEGAEQCDDGNDSGDDACRPDCTSVDPITWTYEREVPGPLATTSVDPIQVSGATLAFAPGPGEQWLVLLSGRVTSTSEAQVSSVVQLTINDRVVSQLGHQTYGLGDGWAGFLVFELVDGGTPVTAEARFAAVAGETRLADVHLVAARLPPGADPVVARGLDAIEGTGLDLTLAELKIEPSRTGRYLIMAEGTVSELPGGDTAELWLADDQGQRYPNDDRGAGWANGRGADLPSFVAVERTLAGPVSFRLSGNSSATGNDGWWNANWQRRLPITLLSEVDVPEGTQVSVVVDHQAMLAAGLAQRGGDDLRIVTVDGVELARVLDDDSSFESTTTRIWFRTSVALTAGVESNDHLLYYGNPQAGAPPADPDQVFELHDSFDGLAVDPKLLIQGVPSLQNGQLNLGPGSTIYSPELLEDDRAVEARLLVRVAPQAGEAYPLATYDPVAGDRIANFGFRQTAEAFEVLVAGTPTAFTPTDPATFQRWRISRRGGEMIMHQAFTERGRGAVVADQAHTIGIGSVSETELSVAWVRARISRGRDPSATLGAPQGPRGTSPSTWRYPKILAFRLDAFPGAYTQFDPALVATDTPDAKILSRLDVPAPAAAGDQLVLQAIRVAGASDATARKQGILQIDGDPQLVTSHRINRDGTRDAGYHHLAGLVDVRRTNAAMVCENAIASPDGISVEGASSSIVVLRYPPR